MGLKQQKNRQNLRRILAENGGKLFQRKRRIFVRQAHEVPVQPDLPAGEADYEVEEALGIPACEQHGELGNQPDYADREAQHPKDDQMRYEQKHLREEKQDRRQGQQSRRPFGINDC